MLEMSFVVLLVIWLVGTASSYTLGSSIHILLVLAPIALVTQVIQICRTA